MHLYFNKEGKLTTVIPHGEVVRQGGNLNLYVLLDEDFFCDKGENYLDWTVNVELAFPDGKLSTHAIPTTEPVLRTFYKTSDSEVTYDLEDGKDYLTYEIKFTPEQATLEAGKIDALVSLVRTTALLTKQGTAKSVTLDDMEYFGRVEIYIEKTFGFAKRVVNESTSHYKNLMKLINNLDARKINREFFYTEIERLSMDKAEVIQLIEEWSTEAEILDIGTAENYDDTSDEQVPTSKAVSNLVNDTKKELNDKIEEKQNKLTEEDFTKAKTMEIGTSKNYHYTDTEIPTTAAVLEIVKENAPENGEGGNTPSQTIVNKYTLTNMKGSEWVRIAKVIDTAKNSNAIITFDCYGATPSGDEHLMTTSTFAINCGVDNTAKFIGDVLPISHAPDLTGSDASGGVSSASLVVTAGEESEPMVTSDVGGSGGAVDGSGAAGVYGLAAVKLERWENEVYVCGLISYPTTDLYTSLKVEMRIENSSNLEALKLLEVVNLDEVNEEEMQVLEGMTLKANVPYEWKIRCNLQNWIDGLENDIYPNIFILSDSGQGQGIFSYNQDNLSILNATFSTRVYPYDVYDYSAWEDALNLEYMRHIASKHPEYNLKSLELDVLKYISHYGGQNYGDLLFSKLSRISMSITVELLSNDDGKEGWITLNGETICSWDASYHGGFSERLYDLDPEKDVLEIHSPDINYALSYIKISALYFDQCELEIKIPDIYNTEPVISSYYISENDTFNMSLKISELTVHNTTESYNMFSVYNELDNIDENVNNKIIGIQRIVNQLKDDISSGIDKAQDSCIINSYAVNNEELEGILTEGVVRLNNTLRAVNLSKPEATPKINHLFFNGTVRDWLNVRFTSGETINDVPFDDRKNTPFNNNDSPTHFYCIQGNEFKELVNLRIPKDITEIPPFAFNDFNSLKSIYIPKNITRICYLSIQFNTNSPSLKELIFEEGSDVLIESRGLGNLIGLEKVVLPTRMTSVYTGGATSINYLICKNLYLGEKLKATRYDNPNALGGGHTMFGINSGYTNLYLNCSIEDWISSELTVPQESPLYRLRRYEEEEVGKVYVKNADGEYEELTEFVIPETAIDSYRFIGIGAKLTLPQTIETILDEQFKGSGVYFEVLPSSCMKVSPNGFESCYKLIKVNTNNAIVHPAAFYGCRNLKKLVIPQGVYWASSDYFLFSSMSSLEVLDIAGNTNNTFENFRFGHLKDSPLKSLVIRATKLINLTVGNDYSLKADVKIYITDDMLETYKSATNWSKYADQMYPLSEYIEEEI